MHFRNIFSDHYHKVLTKISTLILQLITPIFFLLIVGAPSQAHQNPDPHQLDRKLVNDVKNKLDTLGNEFSGAVLIARGSEILFEYVNGEASKSFHIPNNIDTRFNLGSMNKMFTATAVMQLVEQNTISLDDKLSEYLDETWLPSSISEKVTIHQLLTHTSGLGSYFTPDFFDSSRLLFKEIDDYKPLLKDEILAFEPGSDYQYSNTGMLLLGKVVEQASNENYFDYIRDHIYEPAGMTNSDSYELDQPNENLAIGYLRENGKWYNNTLLHVIKGGPAGGGYSTVKDLHAFALTLLSGNLVSEDSFDKIITNHTGNNNYGYGFQVQQLKSGKRVGHGGGFPGLNSYLHIYLDQNIIVAVMSNYDRGAIPITRFITQQINKIY